LRTPFDDLGRVVAALPAGADAVRVETGRVWAVSVPLPEGCGTAETPCHRARDRAAARSHSEAYSYDQPTIGDFARVLGPVARGTDARERRSLALQSLSLHMHI